MKHMAKSDRFFTEQECTRIEEATREIEKKTSGEVAVMVVDSSDDYPEAEITGGVLFAGLAAFPITVLFLHESIWYFIPLFTALFFPFRYLVRLLPGVKVLFLNPRKKEEAVRTRAVRAFYEKGLYKTRENTGVLFFLSLLEHKVWVLADKGIYEKIHQEKLDSFASIVSHGVKEGNACDSLSAAIREAGALLAEHFPVRKDDTDELPNKLMTE